MSPERLLRHDHPDDNEFVYWGELRQVAGKLTDHFRNVLHWMTILFVALMLLTIGLGTILLARINRNTHAAEQAVCAVVLYADNQADTILKRVPKSPPLLRPNLFHSAFELRQLALRMRSTGIHCPPRKP
jgi:hypothetical protein